MDHLSRSLTFRGTSPLYIQVLGIKTVTFYMDHLFRPLTFRGMLHPSHCFLVKFAMRTWYLCDYDSGRRPSPQGMATAERVQ